LQWEKINRDQKPLELYTLIEKVVMKQTGDKYPPHNLVENMLAVLTLKQQSNQSNAQWYEKLNTRVDVAESVGIRFDNFPSLWSYCCEANKWNEYETLTADEQATIRTESKERLLAYLLIVNSSNTSTHESVKNNLLEAFIAKRDEYPDSRTDAIALLNKYDERKPPPTAASEGTAFAQKGKKKAGQQNHYPISHKNGPTLHIAGRWEYEKRTTVAFIPLRVSLIHAGRSEPFPVGRPCQGTDAARFR
jgi:hypothetical protein